MADRTDNFFSAAPTPIYKREPLPGQAPAQDSADSPAMRALPQNSYVAARSRQIQIDQEDARSLEILKSRRQAAEAARLNAPRRTISPDWQPSKQTQPNPPWKRAEQESSVHPVAAALEAEHAKSGITDPAKRVQQFSLMYPHITGAHAIEASKKHAELLRNTLNTIQEANTRAGDTRPAAIHTTAIRDSEHNIWKSVEAKMPRADDGGFDIAESNRRREAAQVERVAKAKAELTPIYAQHAAANPTLHPAHVGDLVRSYVARRTGGSAAHDTAISQLNTELTDKSYDEMRKTDANGKVYLDTSHPRHAAITAGAGVRQPAKTVATDRDSELEPDKGPEYEEPTAAPTKKAPVPREERTTKKQLAAHAQKLVFQHWVKDNPRPVEMDHRDHFAAFKTTSESKNPMEYLKYKMGIANPEGHVKSSLLASRIPDVPETESPVSKPMPALNTMEELSGGRRREKVQEFVKSPLTAARPISEEVKATRKDAFEGGAGARR